MPVELTKSQQHALDAAGEDLRLVDPRSNTSYVLVRAEVFERMRAILDGYTKRAGWDDPALDIYEQYRKPS